MGIGWSATSGEIRRGSEGDWDQLVESGTDAVEVFLIKAIRTHVGKQSQILMTTGWILSFG